MTVEGNDHYVTQTGMVINPSHAYFNIFGVDKVFNTLQVHSYQPLNDAIQQGNIEPDTKLMVFEVGADLLSIPFKQMAFHHVAQGERDNNAWAVFFCACCNMGTAVHPVINGKTLHFSGTGIYHSMAIMRDAETGSFWDNATGECIEGELIGTHLETIPTQIKLAKQIVEDTPSALIVASKQSWFKRLLGSFLLRSMLTPEGHMPAPFRLTLGECDERLPDMQLGLGVWTNGQARFYSMDTLQAQNNALLDTLGQENLVVFIDPIAEVPIAHRSRATSFTWQGDTLVLNTGEQIRNGFVQTPSAEKRKIDPPNQQFARWFAFSYKFPNCEIA